MKLYIVSRSDLSPGARAAQSCHALRAFAEEHSDIDKQWYRESNNLVLLEVADEAGLAALAIRAQAAGVACSVFREPDFDDAITAIALGPAGKKLVSSLPLLSRAA